VTHVKRLLVPTIALAFALVSSRADALGFELGGKLGGGTSLGGADPNPLYFPAVGGRAGLTLGSLYAGLSMTGYPGQEKMVPGNTLHANAMLYGLEGGLGFTFLRHFVLRGVLGVGDLELGDNTTSRSYLYLEPGVLGMVRLDIFFVGLDMNMLLVPAGPTNPISRSNALDAALTSHLQAGVAF
jgi:hypothetical protein